MKPTGSLLFVIVLACAPLPAAVALSTDRDQPAVIDADEVEMDFNSGVRTYRGDVRIQQGTLRITADRVVTYYKDDLLERALAYGKPATFRQRPDGKDEDVYGEGLTIELNELQNLLTLNDEATLTQGGATARGKVIVYDMARDKLTIKGGAQPATATTGESSSATPAKPGRSKVVIQPKSEPQPPQQAPEPESQEEGTGG